MEQQGVVVGWVALGLSVVGTIIGFINHKRIRSRCNKRTVEMSLDIENTTVVPEKQTENIQPKSGGKTDISLDIESTTVKVEPVAVSRKNSLNPPPEEGKPKPAENSKATVEDAV